MTVFTAEVYKERRRQLMELIGPEGVAILAGPPLRQRSHDTQYAYRPSSDILYLTGFKEPETVLVLAPGHGDGEFILFVPDRDPLMEQWEGRRAGPEGAVRDFGADLAFGLSELEENLPKFLAGREQLYYTLGTREDFDRRVVKWTQELRHRRNRGSQAPGQIIDLRDLLFQARLFKSPEEIAVLERACQISSEAHILAMKYCRPGMWEYELQALIEYHFRRSGGEYSAYTTIVGAGDNATILHYTENDCQIGEDDVVLIDAGCEYGFYAGDITRSFPASGKFTPAQRDLYQAVLEVQEAALADLRPGLTYEELQANTQRRITEALVDLGLLSGSVDQLVEEKKFSQYYPHSIGHSLGIDVHDVGMYRESEEVGTVLKKGMVLTIEPGIYVPAADASAPAALRGVGVRIEDDMLITASGARNLTADCPKSVEDVEGLVGSAGGPISI